MNPFFVLLSSIWCTLYTSRRGQIKEQHSVHCSPNEGGCSDWSILLWLTVITISVAESESVFWSVGARAGVGAVLFCLEPEPT